MGDHYVKRRSNSDKNSMIGLRDVTGNMTIRLLLADTFLWAQNKKEPVISLSFPDI